MIKGLIRRVTVYPNRPSFLISHTELLSPRVVAPSRRESTSHQAVDPEPLYCASERAYFATLFRCRWREIRRSEDPDIWESVRFTFDIVSTSQVRRADYCRHLRALRRHDRVRPVALPQPNSVMSLAEDSAANWPEWWDKNSYGYTAHLTRRHWASRFFAALCQPLRNRCPHRQRRRPSTWPRFHAVQRCYCWAMAANMSCCGVPTGISNSSCMALTFCCPFDFIRRNLAHCAVGTSAVGTRMFQ